MEFIDVVIWLLGFGLITIGCLIGAQETGGFSLFLGACGMVLSMAVWHNEGKTDMQLEAIDNGVAKWVQVINEDGTADNEFVWITSEPEETDG